MEKVGLYARNLCIRTYTHTQNSGVANHATKEEWEIVPTDRGGSEGGKRGFLMLGGEFIPP